MKKLLIPFLFFTALFLNAGTAQAQSVSVKKEVYKTTLDKTPQGVRDVLKNYSGYKISSKATYTKTEKGSVYRVRVEKGNWSHFILIDEKGKIIGIETGEHSNG